MTKVVGIDPGHGGKDPGAVGHGIYEKDIALTLSKLTKEIIERNYEGVQCTLTRSTDVFIELDDRPRIAKQHGADVFVSLHCNAFNGIAKGFETIIQTGRSNSTALQDAIHAEAVQVMSRYGIKDRGQKADNLAVLRGSSVPAVLIEVLFIDNAKEAALLKRHHFLMEVAEAIANGIAKYLSLKPKQPTQKVQLYVYGKRVADAVIDANGNTIAPVRELGEALGVTVGWDNQSKTASLRGNTITGCQVIDGRAYAPVRDIATAAGATTKYDAATKRVDVLPKEG